MALKIIVHDLGESIKDRIGVWTVGQTAPDGWSDYSTPVGGTTWGTITGTLSNQTDLQTALNAKVTGNGAIVGATKTKITYDTKGLVTAGADATTADIADSSNRRYVTDAQLVVIGNTSGVNTGDQTSVSGNAGTVTTGDAGGDTTTWPLLGTSQTGNQSPSTDPGLTYNASTNALSTTTFIGNLTGFANGNGFDATVGATGADYTTISAALAASKRKLLIVDDVLETSNCAIPATGLVIYILSNKVIDFATNSRKFTAAGAYHLNISGDNRDGSEIDYAFSSPDYLVDGASAIVQFQNVTVYNDSSSDDTPVCNPTAEQYYLNVRVLCPDHDFAGISAYSFRSSFDTVEINGGGTSCANALDIEDGATLSNILISGVFSATLSGIFFAPATIANLVCAQIGVMVVDFGGECEVSGFTNYQGDITMHCGNNVHISNIEGSGTTVDFQSGDRIKITNGNVQAIDVSDSNGVNGLLSNLRITDAVAFGGDRFKASNCDFIGGASVSSGADDNGFSNCQFGADVGGGALTLTIDAGANRTRVSNCMSDVAIVDNGTGSGIDPVTNLVF